MPIFRTLDEILNDPDTNDAERRLLDECVTGEVVVFGTEVPAPSETSKSIRANVIRYLMLGGCADRRPHEKGVQVRGAHIPDELDLQGCDSDGTLYLSRCRLSAPLTLMGAALRGVNLTGSLCCGQDEDGDAIFADGLKTTGDVVLSSDFRAEGGVRLQGAEIGDLLSCIGGTFLKEGGVALHADGLKITGSVFLSGDFRAEGAVRLTASEIGGDLACEGGRFEATADAALALECDNARIGGTLFWRGGTRAKGVVDLSRAQAAAINDEASCWPDGLELNGFTYGSISGGPVDAAARLDWLARSDARNAEFQPQPYQQLAKVLREMGHEDDARTVMVEKERRQRADRLRRMGERVSELAHLRDAEISDSKAQTLKVEQFRESALLRWLPIWDRVFRLTTGYGYRPFRSIAVLGGLMMVAWLVFAAAWHAGQFAPNSDIILVSQSWADVQAASNPAQAWLDAKAANGHGPGEDYETFLSLAYAADVVIPIIDFGQEAAWAPTTEGWWGTTAWAMRWFLKLFGWIAAALGAAAVTGVVRRD